MAKERKDKHFIKKPIYKGGPSAMKQFIAKNIQYPEAAKAKKIEGTVHVRYTINHLGKVIDGKIISGLGHGCDKEAIRLVKLLKFEVPKNRGVKAQFHKTIQIHFKLREEKKVVQQQVQYQYQVVKRVKKEKEEKQKGGYSYTVRF